ncbi:MAG: hypothetical protein K9M15_00305 [Candidatus Marinimicrobia bacterium]|nr:hypothetical protein [Candidatus Neomarinimicrobiota bacterium]
MKSLMDEEKLKKLSTIFGTPYKKIKSDRDLNFFAHDNELKKLDDIRVNNLDWVFSLISLLLVVLCFIL